MSKFRVYSHIFSDSKEARRHSYDYIRSKPLNDKRHRKQTLVSLKHELANDEDAPPNSSRRTTQSSDKNLALKIQRLSHRLDPHVLLPSRPIYGVQSFCTRASLLCKFTKDLALFIEQSNALNDIQAIVEPNRLCAICYASNVPLDAPKTCGHTACLDCWRHYVDNFVGSFKSFAPSTQNPFGVKLLSCMFCETSVLDFAFIRAVSAESSLLKYKNFFAEARMTRSSQYVQCRRPNCDKVIRVSTVNTSNSSTSTGNSFE